MTEATPQPATARDREMSTDVPWRDRRFRIDGDLIEALKVVLATRPPE